MTESQINEWSFLYTIGTGVVGACLWYREHRARRRAERELEEIQRRAEAPYLATTAGRFNVLYVEDEKLGGLTALTVGTGNVLGFDCEEIDSLPVGTPVFLLVENRGKRARSVAASLDGQPCLIGTTIENGNCPSIQYVRYIYDAKLKGKIQTLELRFETDSGVQGRHLYQTTHGRRALKRIDPPSV